MKLAGKVNAMTSTSEIRVESVDNDHPAWADVLSSIFRTGNQHTLMLGEDGWLSARQTVLAAFDGEQVIGHLSFRVEPIRSSLGRTVVRSKVDSFSVEPEYTEVDVEEMLLKSAESRAHLMQCAPPRVERAAC
jgi:hypothetical protein